MRKHWFIAVALISVTFILGGCGSEPDESKIEDKGKGGIVVENREPAVEKAPATKTLTIFEGEMEQQVESVLYRSDLGYSLYLVEKFKVNKGENQEQIISDTFPQNKMILTLLPQGTELNKAGARVEEELNKNYSQVGVLKEVEQPVKGLQIDALDLKKGHTRIYLAQSSTSVYKIELFYDEYSTNSMLPRFDAMLKELHF